MNSEVDFSRQIRPLGSTIFANMAAYLQEGCAVLLEELDRAQQAPERWPGAAQDPQTAALREACATNQQLFMETFFPDACRHPFSPMHLDFFALENARIRDNVRGWRDATAAPRGNGKSTLKSKVQVIHKIVYGYERYVLICSANTELARDKVREIRDIFTENTRLIHAYGPQETRDWRQSDFITACGARIRAFTPRSKARGLLWRNRRPTLILLDDAEDPETVLTPLRRERFAAWYANDVSKLGDAETNFDVVGTILNPQSLLAELLKNPGYNARLYHAVIHFADTTEAWNLWSQWREILLDLQNTQRLADAEAFFHDHEAAMLAGSEVLWPASENYYQLMLSRIVDGESSFWQEKQNTPLGDARYLFNMEAAAYCVVRPTEIIRHDHTVVSWHEIADLAAYWDPTPDKQRAQGTDYASCVIVARDTYGYLYVLDAYVKQEASTDQQIADIAWLLHQWRVPLLGLEGNSFQSLMANNLRQAIAKLNQEAGTEWSCDVIPVVNMKNKILRIRSLEPLINNHWIQFSRLLPAQAYLQLSEFLPVANAGHDDFPDALEGAVRTVRGLLTRRDSGAA